MLLEETVKLPHLVDRSAGQSKPTRHRSNISAPMNGAGSINITGPKLVELSPVAAIIDEMADMRREGARSLVELGKPFNWRSPLCTEWKMRARLRFSTISEEDTRCQPTLLRQPMHAFARPTRLTRKMSPTSGMVIRDYWRASIDRADRARFR